MGNKPSKTPEEVLAETKAVVNKSIRELDRQSRTLERRQNQIKAEMRKSAKQGKTSLLAIQAKEYTKCKNGINRCVSLRAQFTTIQMDLQHAVAQESMARSIEGVVKGMKAMASVIDPQRMQEIVGEFGEATALNDSLQELMEGRLDTVTGENDEEDEAALVQSVLAEVGIDQVMNAADATSQQLPLGVPQSSMNTADFASRLNGL